MEYLIRTTIKEMEELGVLDAYYAKFNLDSSDPAPVLVTMTLSRAEKIGLVTASEPKAEPKPKKASRKAK